MCIYSTCFSFPLSLAAAAVCMYECVYFGFLTVFIRKKDIREQGTKKIR